MQARGTPSPEGEGWVRGPEAAIAPQFALGQDVPEQDRPAFKVRPEDSPSPVSSTGQALPFSLDGDLCITPISSRGTPSPFRLGYAKVSSTGERTFSLPLELRKGDLRRGSGRGEKGQSQFNSNRPTHERQSPPSQEGIERNKNRACGTAHKVRPRVVYSSRK